MSAVPIDSLPVAAHSVAPPADANALVLRDIHLPPDPSWWPPAPGWWVVTGVLLLAIAVAVLWWRRRGRRHGHHAQILAEIDRLATADDAELAAGLHQWLRRAARAYAPEAIRLRGAAWREVLAQVPVDDVTLDQLQLLEQRMYSPVAAFDREAALAATRRWMVLALRQRPRSESLAPESAHA
jgi:Domain of unknown function (DUF4381)